MSQRFEIEDVLKVLDSEVNECRFPVWGWDDVTRECSVGIRLHAFASTDSWLLAFERLMFSSLLREYQTNLDGISAVDTVIEYRYPIEVLLPDGTWSNAVWKGDLDPLDYMDCLLNPFGFMVRVNGTPREFSFTKNDYLTMGIDLDEPKSGKYQPVDTILAIDILRMINHELGDELYAAPANLLSILRHADANCRATQSNSAEQYRGLQHLLTIKDYFHPSYDGPEPSKTETFRMLAEIMVHKDPSRYHPTEEPNTRWSDWPFPGYQV